MPSKSYLSLLVLALAASTVSPVRCAETQQIEDWGHTSSAPASGSLHRTRAMPGRVKLGIGLGIGLKVLLTVALVMYYHDHKQKSSETHPIPPTDTTQPSSPHQSGPPYQPSSPHQSSPPYQPSSPYQPSFPYQPNNPPRAFVGREERDLGGGSPVDTFKARSINNQDGRTSSSLDLLSRADLREELILQSNAR